MVRGQNALKEKLDLRSEGREHWKSHRSVVRGQGAFIRFRGSPCVRFVFRRAFARPEFILCAFFFLELQTSILVMHPTLHN